MEDLNRVILKTKQIMYKGSTWTPSERLELSKSIRDVVGRLHRGNRQKESTFYKRNPWDSCGKEMGCTWTADSLKKEWLNIKISVHKFLKLLSSSLYACAPSSCCWIPKQNTNCECPPRAFHSQSQSHPSSNSFSVAIICESIFLRYLI